jgi:hypothetical protein
MRNDIVFEVNWYTCIQYCLYGTLYNINERKTPLVFDCQARIHNINYIYTTNINLYKIVALTFPI